MIGQPQAFWTVIIMMIANLVVVVDNTIQITKIKDKIPSMVKGELMKRTVEMSYEEYWVIRVIRDDGYIKSCVNEIVFQTEPTEQDIVNVLLTCGKGEFISIAHNYRRRTNIEADTEG